MRGNLQGGGTDLSGDSRDGMNHGFRISRMESRRQGLFVPFMGCGRGTDVNGALELEEGANRGLNQTAELKSVNLHGPYSNEPFQAGPG